MAAWLRGLGDLRSVAAALRLKVDQPERVPWMVRLQYTGAAYWLGYDQDGATKIVSLLKDQPAMKTGPAESPGQNSVTVEVDPQTINQMTQADATGELVYMLSDKR